MENAIDALKLAFAVFVFAIALTLTFSVVGQARVTADIVLSLNDKTNYYDYVEQDANNAKGEDRIVDFETILPTIYRYAKEQYAVTILDEDGTPIVRYDLYTENFMNGWDETLKRQQKAHANGKVDQTYQEIEDRIEHVDDFIRKEFSANDDFKPIWNSLNNNNGLYAVTHNNNSSIHHAAPWLDSDKDIIHRIQTDFGSSNAKYEKDGIEYKSKNLNQYKDMKFKEKFLEIQTSGTTLIEPDEDNNIEYSLETVKGNKKLEIIYILQE